MKKTGNNRYRIAVSILTVYALLITVLVLAEKDAENATITCVPNALWYSVTTLTTVGYGDTYPVTGTGKVIGFIFQMLSLGVLAALVGFLFRAFRTQLIPKLLLAAKRGSTWAVFSSDSDASLMLAGRLKEEHPDYEILFALPKEESEDDLPGMKLTASVPEVLSWQKGKGKALVFCMDEDEYENRRLAQLLKNTEAEVYCLSADEPDEIPLHQTYFNRASCMARMYWQKYPALNRNENIVIAGSGEEAPALLEQGLMVNITSPDQTLSYTLCGDWNEFRRNHPYLKEAADFGENTTGDIIRFTQQPWNQDWDIYRKADRIILCSESEAENAAVLSALRRYCPIHAAVHVRDHLEHENAVCFGSTEEIFTPELVMRKSLNRLAEELHGSYLAHNSGSLPDWNHLSEFLRRSNLASADHLYMKALILTDQKPDNGKDISGLFRKAAEIYSGLDAEKKETCRRIEHMRWNRFHLLNNWQYAEVRDNQMRRHPLIRPFDSLPVSDQAKDDYAWELLEEAAQLHL